METLSEPLTTSPATELLAWKALEAHYKKVRRMHLRKLFADDPNRGERLAAQAVGLYLDYSKNHITDETLRLLFELAEESEKIPDRIPIRHGSYTCSQAGRVFPLAVARGWRENRRKSQ